MTKAQKALKARRSAAAKHGWEMRRFRANLAARPLSPNSVHFTPISPQARKSIVAAARSAAAKKGWETRRAASERRAGPIYGWILAPVPGATTFVDSDSHAPKDAASDPYSLNPREVSDYLAKHDPNPWPRIASQVRDWWLRATGWFR